jgi:hypothetical protein
MNSSPGLDGLLEGVIFAIRDDLMPNLDPKSQASAAMMQSILQAVRQILPVYDAAMIEEHNDMTRTLRDAAAQLAGVAGPEADRIRERAATLGQRADLPAPADRTAVSAAHTELGRALEANIADLDVVQRAGGAGAEAADAALNAVRAHLAPRYLRDYATFSVGAGFLGRG